MELRSILTVKLGVGYGKTMRIVGILAILCSLSWLAAGLWHLKQLRSIDVDALIAQENKRLEAASQQAGFSITSTNQRASLEQSQATRFRTYRVLAICGGVGVVAGIVMLFRIPAGQFIWLALASGVLFAFLMAWARFIWHAGAARLPSTFGRGLAMLAVPCLLSWWQFIAAKRKRQVANNTQEGIAEELGKPSE